MASNYGPALPPGFKTRRDSSDSEDDDEKRDGDRSYAPKLPAGHTQNRGSHNEQVVGPALPPGLASSQSIGPALPCKDNKQSNNKSGSTSKQNYYGPALPPGYTKDEEDDDTPPIPTYGVALPPGYHSNTRQSDEADSNSDSDSEDDDIIGPMPSMGSGKDFSVVEEFEARAKAMKNRLTGKDEPKAPQRESWMTELPEYSKAFGLGPRGFRKTAAPDMEDRSEWTDTPADKARKAMEREKARHKKQTKKEPEEVKMSERDKQIARQVEGYNKDRRSETLIDMHVKERKRKSEEEGANPNERRPFDREIDLQVNRFDDAKRKRMMKQSAGLDNKFSHSKESRYL